MSRLYVSTLPSSLSFLKNLHTFRVDDCYQLKDISIVGELKKLQTLSLVDCGIEELPSGIGQLFELRLLDLSNCSKLRIIPAGLIAGLSRLEELKMRGSFDRWDDEANVSLSELNHLLNLTSLEIAVSDAKLLPKDLSFEKLEKYEIIVGDKWNNWNFRQWVRNLEVTRIVCLQLNTTSINQLQHVVEKLFKRTECLCLGKLKGVKNVTPQLDVDGFPYMKHLLIERDYEIQYIVNVEYMQHKASFPALESLHLIHLQELQKICNGRLMEDSFYNLKVLNVANCNRLVSLFSFSMAIEFRCLQEIHVSACSVLEEIVAKKNREDDDVNSNDGVCEKIEFVKLQKLSLKRLPKLNNFYGGKMVSIQKEMQRSLTTNVESEEIVSEELSMLFFKKVSFPKLEEMELSEISNMTQIWSHKLSEMHCRNLTRLTVENCDNLQYLLTPSVSMALVGLRDLIVKSCVKMKNIVAEQEGETKTGAICFPHLSYLCLERLPNLTTFYSGSVEEWDPNVSLDIAIQPLFNEKVSFPKMEKLELSEISNPTEIWIHQVQELLYCNLRTLTVHKCNNLEYLLTPSITTGLVRLQHLTIRNCARMKHVVAKEEGKSKMVTIVSNEEGEATAAYSNAIIFPQLTLLQLEVLPNLTRFYSSVEEMDSYENLDYEAQPLFNQKIQFPKLEGLSIARLDSINSLWLYQVEEENITSSAARKKESHEVFSFQNVQIVTVCECKSLEHVFPVSVAQSLHKIEKLWIEECEKLKTIIGDKNYPEEAVKATEQGATTFVFPKLINLKLKWLKKLECFYPREHTSEWPTLEVLDVWDCDKVSAFDFLRIPEKQGDIQFEKAISELKFMSLTSQQMSKILRLYHDDHILQHLFLSLERLTITEFHGEASTFPSRFLSLIHNQLREFRVYNCSFQEIFPCDGEVSDHANSDVLLPQLKTLHIEKLPELKYICKKDQYLAFIHVLGKLINLHVTECNRLTNFVLPSVSFGSLQFLNVTDCGGLIDLIPLSTATTLEHLRCLYIRGCERIEEIIGEVKDDDQELSSFGHEIIFNKLWCLRLVKLPRLTNFSSSRSYTFNFPALDVVCVEECPNMKTFSRGITTAPKLTRVYLNESWSEERWEGELNTTIEHIYAKRVAKRLAMTIPSTSSNNQFGENSAEGVSESRTEGQTRENATNQERVANIVDKGKGKEVEVSKEVTEHFEKPQETPRSSDPSCSNYAAYLAPSQHVGASSSQLSPQISNPLHEVSPAIEVEVQTVAASTISPNNQIEEKVQFHEKPRKEGLICKNGELVNEYQVCDNGTDPGKETELCGISKEVTGQGKAKLAATCGKVEEQTIAVSHASRDVEASSSNSQQKDIQELNVPKHFIPLMSKVLEILQTRPLNSMTAQHVQFMEEASRDLSAMNFPMEWLCPYVDKAKKCLSVVDRTKAISEVELKIAEVEAQLQALKESKKALEEENKVIELSIDLDKPLYED